MVIRICSHISLPTVSISTVRCIVSTPVVRLLSATHIACRSLLFGECDLALAGGITIDLPQKSGYFCQQGMIHSTDGHCRPFDSQASGTLFGDGAGVVVLRRLEDALAAGDRIYAVIRGSAVNNDGKQKSVLSRLVMRDRRRSFVRPVIWQK